MCLAVGRYEGHDEYFGAMAERMAPLDEWQFTVTTLTTNERDRAALVSFHLVGSRQGVDVETGGHHMIRLDEEGRILEGWGFTEDHDALDRFSSA